MRMSIATGTFFALMFWNVAVLGGITDCTDGCVIVTCDADSCQVYHCEAGSCDPIGSFPLPQAMSSDEPKDPEVTELSAGMTALQCGTEPCAVRTCTEARTCYYWGFRGGEAYVLGETDRADEPYSTIDRFLEGGN